MSVEFASAFAAFVTLGLIVATLDAGIFVQKNLLSALARHCRWRWLENTRTALLATVALVAALALYDGHGQGALALWPLFGLWNQVMALGGFALIALALRRRHQPTWFVTVPALLLFGLTIWALLWQLALWWRNANWSLLSCGIALLALGIWLGWETVRAWKHTRGGAPDA